MTIFEIYSAMSLELDICMAQNLGDRKEQQDRIAVFAHPKVPNITLCVLADGMGGHEGGALAADQVIHTARLSLSQYDPDVETPEHFLETLFNDTHTLIKSSRFINEKDPHSTAVFLLLQPGLAMWAHCGDSRIYFLRGVQVLRRTIDHSYVQRMISQGRITPLEAKTHPQRGMLTTSLGGRDAPHFDIDHIEHPEPGLSFILCSDGLWAYFSDEEMGVICGTQTAKGACQHFINLARNRAHGYGDNVSLIVVKLFEKDDDEDDDEYEDDDEDEDEE